MKCGEVWLADFDQHPDSRQNGVRPAIVVQMDALNDVRAYTLTILVPLSTKGSEAVPTQISIDPNRSNGLTESSWAKCEQIVALPKARIIRQLGTLSAEDLSRVGRALKRTLGLE